MLMVKMFIKIKVFINLLFFYCCFFSINVFSSMLNFRDTSSQIILNSGTTLTLNTQVDNFKGKIVKPSSVNINGSILFSEGVLEEGGNKVRISGVLDFSEGNKLILSGEKFFQGKWGQVLQDVYVDSINNEIFGVFELDNDINLQDSNTSLSMSVVNSFGGDINLNGGTLNLSGDLRLKDNKRVKGPGKVDLNNYKLSLGTKKLIWDESVHFKNAADMELSSNLDLTQTWTFEGDSVILGNKNILELIGDGNIIVLSNSTLTIKDITFRNISNNNIRCEDDTAKIIFQNVHLIQSADFTFSKGAIEIIDELIISGDYKFIYNSSFTSTVDKYSILYLDGGITFSYDPGIVKKDLIEFEDSTSILCLNNATLHTTATGMILKKGKMIVNKIAYLSSDIIYENGRIVVDESITFGNDVSADDFLLEIVNGSGLILSQGSLSYRNVLSNSSILYSKSFLSLGESTKLKLYQNIDVSDGVLNCYKDSTIARVLPKKVNGSISVRENINWEVLE